MIDPKDLIDLIVEYSIIHVPRIRTPKGTYYGITSPADHEIYLADKYSINRRRKAAIHEFLHAFYESIEVKKKESDVEAESNEQFEDMFTNRIRVYDERELKMLERLARRKKDEPT